ncbi:MAG: alanine--tRNA ligase, partial [Planctomycetota bacterium]|nr:alanine--tRNA ligase [Planctomycetota bacterium]
TNAGMNQFKPIFLGQVDPDTDFGKLTRAVNSQKCIRAGGKHNDLDDVGKDLYHHTFFEMLGNWSFGDYFKREAIHWAWELLTKEWGLDPERLYATYFEGDKSLGLDPDREAYDLWCELLPPQRVLPGNTKDNFWEMGDTGPCGPCSELHYDGRDDDLRARDPGYNRVNRDDPDVIEIWNLVFIQFNRTESGLKPLPAKHVDTGMGFERITRILQGKTSNYDTDVFTPLFSAINSITNAPAYEGDLHAPRDIAYRVIADHIRTLVFAITDGAEPGNEGRGYVLRRILRRAVRHGRQTLGATGPFLHQLVPTVIEHMGPFFPELKKDPRRVAEVIRDEEEAFGRTIDRGIALFETAANTANANFRKDNDREIKKPVVAAEDAFKLHDTYGFPIDLTEIMAEERGMTVDVAGFNNLMEQAREKARAGGAKSESGHPAATLPGDAVARLKALNIKPTDDEPKFDLRTIRARVRAIWNGRDFDENIKAANSRPDQRFGVVLDRTNCYAEMGGQVGDTARLVISRETRSSERDANTGGEFRIEDTQIFGGYVLHIGRIVKGEIRINDEAQIELEKNRRQSVMAHHTATHLLNFALRETLGDRVDQKGSLVAPDRLRFDFSHSAAVSAEEIDRAESIVRAQIEADLPVCADTAPLPLAKKVKGLRAVFGETYPDPVRVVSIGAPISALVQDPDSDDWRKLSIEFCGGTHLPTTGAAGAFAVIEESAVSKGVRRMVALTGKGAESALAAAASIEQRLDKAAKLDDAALESEATTILALLESETLPVVRRRAIAAKLEALQDRLKAAKKQAAKADRAAAVDAARDIAQSASGPVIVEELPGAGADRAALLGALDSIRAAHPQSAVMLLGVDHDESKVVIVANVPRNLIDTGLKAGDWVRAASEACGGKGGGRPDSAQGGGSQPDKLTEAIAAAKDHAAGKVAV